MSRSPTRRRSSRASASTCRRHGETDVRLFTLGARFLPGAEGSLLPDEVPSFAAVIAGQRDATLAKRAEVDVFDAKGIAVEIVERVTRQAATVAAQPASVRAP